MILTILTVNFSFLFGNVLQFSREHSGSLTSRNNPTKGSHCFIEQETVFSLLSTGWFQERIQAWFHNRTKID